MKSLALSSLFSPPVQLQYRPVVIVQVVLCEESAFSILTP